MLIAIVYAIYISIRLVYGLPSVFISTFGPVEAIKSSFKLTRFNMKDAAIIFLISAGLGILTRGAFDAFYSLVFYIGIETNVFLILLYILPLIALVIVYGFVICFQQLYLFYAYNENKKSGK